MPASFKAGDVVQQKMPAPLCGIVVKFGEVEGELGYCIQLANGDQKWFRESELVAAQVPDEPEAP
jgi:hypothetical protein